MRADVYDFWHRDDLAAKEGNGLVRFLRGCLDIEIDTSEPEVVFYSCFGDGKRCVDGALRVQYLGENRRPDTSRFDCSFSFDREESPEKMRLPLYLLYDEWYREMERINDPRVKLSETSAPRKFCGALVSNPGCPPRNEIIENLLGRGLLESGGGCFNNLGRSVPENESLDFRRGYRFFLAYENSAHPGYVTEKIVGAMAAGCIPVYWGAEDIGLDFNPRSFINARDFDSVGELVHRMEEVYESGEEQERILARPWLSDEHIRAWGRGSVCRRACRFLQENMKRIDPAAKP